MPRLFRVATSGVSESSPSTPRVLDSTIAEAGGGIRVSRSQIQSRWFKASIIEPYARFRKGWSLHNSFTEGNGIIRVIHSGTEKIHEIEKCL